MGGGLYRLPFFLPRPCAFLTRRNLGLFPHLEFFNTLPLFTSTKNRICRERRLCGNAPEGGTHKRV